MATIVYLDQNKWIPLLQQKKGQISGYETELKAVEELSKDDTVVFALSHLTLKETASYSGGRDKVKEMIKFMTDISNQYFFAPADIVRQEEITREAHRLAGLEYSIEDKVLGQGPLFAYWGSRVDIDATTGGPDDEIEEQLREWSQSEEGMKEMILNDDVLSVVGDRSGEQELADSLEAIRKENKGKFKSNDHQRELTTLHYLQKTVRPEVQAEFTQLLLSTTDIEPLANHEYSDDELESKEFALEYIHRFPYADTYTTLTVSRDLEKQKVTPTDKNDIMALSVAIPYSDLVITEKFWASVAAKTGLEEKYNTRVRSELSAVLELS